MIDWTSQDIKDMIEDFLTNNLTIEVENGHWTDPNTREVNLILAGEVISTAYFNVSQKAEYEG